jgi:hypothetical protein
VSDDLDIEFPEAKVPPLTAEELRLLDPSLNGRGVAAFGPFVERHATPSRDPVPTPSPVDPVPRPHPLRGDGDDDPVPDPVPEGHSWVPVDLVSAAANPPEPPDIIGLFYVGANHLVSGESEALKTWLALAAAVDELKAGRGVVWVDGEDVGAGAVLERLRLLGADEEVIRERFAYMRPDEPLGEGALMDVLEVVRELECRLMVLDGFNPLMVLHGLNPNEGVDVERFYALFAPVKRLGVAVVLTDNVVKDQEARKGWAIGSERKRSKAEVHLGMKTLAPLVRGGTGKAKIDVHKDRPGHLEKPSPGVLVVESVAGYCSWRIVREESRGERGEFRPTVLMEKVLRFLELREDAQSRTQIVEGVSGKTEYVRVAIDTLIREGYATEFEGARGARLVRLERAFSEADDDIPL